ncbi:TlpA family protein disulfide reductase [Campylobacter mucosalis]|uniref:Putative periplasmic thioredoxin n=1 Tax=Campylobacter mucosalis CCUG 21559 TaxID=1032067 RepID=A0A6G5QIP0_9BACT|nr:TlpA family protein disulfide reductase [Campylobacter mucosalis]QCD45479.1 putative periplasmic thioredoxin [Campylobacter mucosalis CCUG 21559]
MRKILLLLATLFFIFGCGSDDSSKPDKIAKFKPFGENEEIVLKGVSGKELVLVRKNGGFVLKGAEDKILMLDIFGTFCPPCQKEAPNIMQYQIDNADKFALVALTHFENVTDEYVQSEFVQKYNAFYFITNNQEINDRIAEQIVKDIDYKREIALPFKVVLKNGEYQVLTDIDTGKFGVKYYLGGIDMTKMQNDLKRVYELK